MGHVLQPDKESSRWRRHPYVSLSPCHHRQEAKEPHLCFRRIGKRSESYYHYKPSISLTGNGGFHRLYDPTFDLTHAWMCFRNFFRTFDMIVDLEPVFHDTRYVLVVS